MHGIAVAHHLVLVFAVALALALWLGRRRLPAVLAYIVTGVLLGPQVLGLIDDTHSLEVLAEVGVVLLLFTVGMEIHPSEIAENPRPILLGGLAQLVLTIGGSTALASLFGLSLPSALTVGFIISLSSTAVVIRLLDVRGESKAAHGRLVIGILIFQDLAVVPIMLILPLLASGTAPGWSIVWVLARASLVLTGVLAGSLWLVPWLLDRVSETRNREVFLLAVLAIAGLTAWVAASAGLSLALGAFAAGMVLANTHYAHQALADVLPLRTVMMAVFFVSIGMLVDVDLIVAWPIVVFALAAMIIGGKFAASWLAAVVIRVPVRVAALAAVALAQVGEFSFVLTVEAERLGLLQGDQARVLMASSVITLSLAPVALALCPRLLAGSRIVRPLARLLDPGINAPVPMAVLDGGHVVVAGWGPCGRAVTAAAQRCELKAVIVELNPKVVSEERARGHLAVYGDVSATEVLVQAGIAQARLLVLTLPDMEASRRAVKTARALNPNLPIILRTRYVEDEKKHLPGVEVISEESACAVEVAAAALRECGASSEVQNR